MSRFDGFFASHHPSEPIQTTISNPLKQTTFHHPKKVSLSFRSHSNQLQPHHSSSNHSSDLSKTSNSRSQLEIEDEAVYGPPSPRPNPPPSGLAPLSLPSFSLSTSSSSQTSTFVPDLPAPTDELFLSEQYPPIQSRLYPFFDEKLSSPLGMGRGDPITHQPTPPTLLALAHTWHRISRSLSRTLPELPDSLSYPADEIAISRLDAALGAHRLNLPAVVRASLLTHDGQDVFTRSSVATDGLVWGLWLMSSEEVEAEWGFWRRLDGGHLPGDAFSATDFSTTTVRSGFEGQMSSCPSGWVREVYSHPGWLPLLSDRVGNYIGVDLSPPMVIEAEEAVMGGGQGHARPAPGQVIAFGREIDEKVVLWRGDGPEGWAGWLASFADDLEQGNFAHPGGLRPGRRRAGLHQPDHERGWAAESDEDEEDGLGDVGYFHDGTSGGYGPSDEVEFKGWKLCSEYRGMGIIQALCARSKKRWAEIGLYSSRSPTPSKESFIDPRIGPSPSSSQPPDQTTSLDVSQPDTPIAFVTPPSPRASAERGRRAPELPVASGSGTSEPHHHHHHHHHHHQGWGPVMATPVSRSRPRRPPPAPACLALPTMDEVMAAGAAADEIEEEEPVPVTTTAGRFVVAGLRRMSEEANARAETIGMSPISASKLNSASTSTSGGVGGVGGVDDVESCGLEVLSLVDRSRPHTPLGS